VNASKRLSNKSLRSTKRWTHRLMRQMDERMRSSRGNWKIKDDRCNSLLFGLAVKRDC
jgi:hypothetical protein